jgi:hypothetical protein
MTSQSHIDHPIAGVEGFDDAGAFEATRTTDQLRSGALCMPS